MMLNWLKGCPRARKAMETGSRCVLFVMVVFPLSLVWYNIALIDPDRRVFWVTLSQAGVSPIGWAILLFYGFLTRPVPTKVASPKEITSQPSIKRTEESIPTLKMNQLTSLPTIKLTDTLQG